MINSRGVGGLRKEIPAEITDIKVELKIRREGSKAKPRMRQNVYFPEQRPCEGPCPLDCGLQSGSGAEWEVKWYWLLSGLSPRMSEFTFG